MSTPSWNTVVLVTTLLVQERIAKFSIRVVQFHARIQVFVLSQSLETIISVSVDRYTTVLTVKLLFHAPPTHVKTPEPVPMPPIFQVILALALQIMLEAPQTCNAKLKFTAIRRHARTLVLA